MPTGQGSTAKRRNGEKDGENMNEEARTAQNTEKVSAQTAACAPKPASSDAETGTGTKTNPKPEEDRIFHPFGPFYDRSSRFLILSSFPSVKSREAGFFYGHPRNRFWRVLAGVFGLPAPGNEIPEKQAFLRACHAALWDVTAACRITGSADAAIRNASGNDLAPLLQNSAVSAIFVNGKTALTYYNRFQLPETGIPAILLPSTSPANAAWSEAELIRAWRQKILPALG